MIRSVDSLPSGIREKLHTKHTNTEENNTKGSEWVRVKGSKRVRMLAFFFLPYK